MGKIAPNQTLFLDLAKRGNTIPMFREILADLQTPVAGFLKMDDGRWGFLLESVEGGENWGRYSFLGSSPRWVFKSSGHSVSIEKNGGVVSEVTVEDPLDSLKELIAKHRTVCPPGLPRFFGGAVGYIGYGMARFWEKLPPLRQDTIGLPECLFLGASDLVIFDNVKQTIKVVCLAIIEPDQDPLATYKETAQRIDALVSRLAGPVPVRPKAMEHSPAKVVNWVEKEDFVERVVSAKEHIAAGDVIQVVLSQRFEAELNVDPFSLYRSLRVTNPSPYLFFLRLADACLIGSSPEVMVRVEKGEVTVRPIAGTRPRGASEEEDRRLEEELTHDPKERAEHIMLVDLGRNDVGRVAKIGTVKVTDRMIVERYSHVMHLVSNVTGELKNGLDAFDALRATFPAGTLTGAPKIRAMEIIDELESTGRGVYGGAVGYIGFAGSLDTCIAIRTMFTKDGKVFFQSGAGIVADSDPEREHQECLSKAMAMVTAIQQAEEGLVG